MASSTCGMLPRGGLYPLKLRLPMSAVTKGYNDVFFKTVACAGVAWVAYATPVLSARHPGFCALRRRPRCH